MRSEVMYIPRGLALDACYNVLNGSKIPTVRAVIDALKKLDVVTAPVPAKWEESKDGFTCSNCGSLRTDKTCYCPDCGAMMKDMQEVEE